MAACDADSGANQSMGKKDFLIFSSDIFIERVLAKPRAPLRPCQSHLRKSEWGFRGGGLQGFIRTRRARLPLPGKEKGEHRNMEGEMNTGGNDELVRAGAGGMGSGGGAGGVPE